MRSLPVLVPAAVILGRACPLASIRQVRTWRLAFVERDPARVVRGRPAGWTETVDVEARPRRADPATTTWPTHLAGDGFRAFWSAPRRVEGLVRLHGDLVVDPLDGRPTTGRIHRVRLVTDVLDATGDLVAVRSRDLSAIPKTVDDAGTDPADPAGPAGSLALRTGVRTRDRGVLLDLELGVGR